jgi:hypothetical protein
MIEMKRAILGVAAMIATVAAGCSSNSEGGASTAAICKKCEGCYAQDPSFQEGYCDPFWDGTKFDISDCEQHADPKELDSHPSDTDLAKMSCTEFDNAI